jgi:hypothetical protein
MRATSDRSAVDDHVEQAARIAIAHRWSARCRALVGAKGDFESEKPADEHDEILQRAMALFANRSLTLLEQRAGRRTSVTCFEKKPRNRSRGESNPGAASRRPTSGSRSVSVMFIACARARWRQTVPARRVSARASRGRR